MDVERIHYVVEIDEDRQGALDDDDDDVFGVSLEDPNPHILIQDQEVDSPSDEENTVDSLGTAEGVEVLNMNSESESLSDGESFLEDDWFNDEFEHLTEQSAKSGKQDVSTEMDRVAMLRLRRELNEINKLVTDCQLQVEESKRELTKCREMIDGLKAEQLAVEAEIRRCEKEKNIAATMRLKGQQTRIVQQIETEKSMEQQIRAALDKAELSLDRAELEQHRYHVTGEHLAGNELLFEIQNEIAIERRLQKEVKTANAAAAARKTKKREHIEAIKRAQQRQKAIEAEAKRSQAKAAKFLEETLSKVRQEDVAKQQYNRSLMEQRMETLLSLKTNIQDNRDSMKALQMIRNKQQSAVDSEEMAERQKAIEAGLNPDEVIMKRRRMQSFTREKELFDDKQLKNKVEIVQKLLLEQKNAKRKEKKGQQPHWQDKWLQKDKSCSAITSHVVDGKTREAAEVGTVSVVREDVQGDGTLIGQQKEDGKLKPSSDEKALSEPISTTDDLNSEAGQVQGKKDKSVGIQGLWQTSEQKSPSEQSRVKEQSKIEKEIMQRVMDKLKESAVITQVAAGREFKGKPFNSKPEVVLFEDFDLGKMYRKRVVLTNVSYSVNYCKLQGTSESLANCIDISFDPPGPMSAGMTCEMTVTFTPEINTDLEGEISFLAQTGPFSVPIRCVTKKCRVSVSSSCIEFRPACVGETRKRTIRLTNDGALGTDYEIRPLSGRPQRKSDTVQPVQLIVSETETVKSSSTPSENEMPNGASTGDVIGCGKNLEHVSSSLLDTVVEREDEVDEEPANEESTELKESKRKTSDMASCDLSETKGTHVTTSVVDSMAENDQSLVQSEVTVEMVALTQVLVESGKEDSGDASEVSRPVEGPALPLKLGVNSKGYLDLFSAVDIEFVFAPTVAGDFEEKYKIVFAEEETEEITLTLTASAIDLPIYIEREAIDLKICMLERLYQDSVTVHNRSATALRVTFDVPPNVREHMEVLPKHGLVQGESFFSAQLKFLPRHSVLDACSERMNAYTGKLKVPISIQVVDQTRPVPFNVLATVTGSDLEFSRAEIDFGTCTVYESVVSSVHLTNKSILPQTFGFVQLPKGVDVQPNDGFGTLLPEETISLDVIFSPKKAKEYKFTLKCKSGIGREFLINCSAIAILPALRLSKNIIEFCPTPVEDSRSTHFYVENPIHSSLSEESIRGQTPPSLPMAFEFAVPVGCPLSISPAVGIVNPGEKHQVSVMFSPRLDQAIILAKAWNLAKEKATQAARAAREAAEMAAAKDVEEASQLQAQKKKKLGGRKSGSGSKVAPRSQSSMGESRKETRKTSAAIEIPEPAEGSDDYWEAYATLLRNFESESTRVFVPCFVAAVRKPGQLEYRPQDTLYVELSLPTVRPKLVVVSDHGRRAIDYGPVCKGHMKVKTVTVKNISEEILTLRSSVLDPDGTFEMRNALRPVPPGRVHNIMLGFCPATAEQFCEVFKVLCGDSSIPLRLCGEGITPEVCLSLNQDVIDLGDLLSGDSSSSRFTITNTSPISVQYCVRLDSSLLGLKSTRRFCPHWFTQSGIGDGSNQFETGVRCNDGSCAFDVSPFEAVIKAGESREVTVTFSPDHPSQCYFDTARIELSTQDEAKAVRLTGRCWPNTVYATGWDDFASRREFLGADFQTLGAEGDGKLPTVTVSLTCRSLGGKPSTRQIEIGCIKSALVKKASGDFAFDPLPTSLAKTFQVDNLKTNLEGGSKKTVTVTFCPPTDHKPSDVITAKTMLTLKGEKIQQFEVHLRGIIKSASLGC